MGRQRFTPEQIIAKLLEVDVIVGRGSSRPATQKRRPQAKKQTEPFPDLLRRNDITRRLTEVTVLPQDNEYLVRLRSNDGSVFELVATFDQLDEDED